MSKNSSSEVICCPNQDWRLFKRNGTFYADGRKHGNGKHSLATSDRKQAIRELNVLDERIADGAPTLATQLPAPASVAASSHTKGAISIRDGWDLYIEKRSIPIHLGGLKQSSIRKYKGHQKRFVAYSQANNVSCWSQVDRELLEHYAMGLDNTLAPITIHDDLTMEISVSNWLIKNKHISYDCKINWQLQKPPGAEQYCYERDEVTRMLALAKTNKRYPWFHPMIFLLSHTGVQIGEAINLKWTDIDTKRGVIHIRDETYKKKEAGKERRTVKGKKSRILPIHPSFSQFISTYPRGSKYFLVGKDGRKRSYSHTLDPFKDHIIKPLMSEFPTPEGELGFADGRFHSFRHFFVSECFAAGIPESDIKDWVGHSESKILQLYRHIRSKSAKANMGLGEFGA